MGRARSIMSDRSAASAFPSGFSFREPESGYDVLSTSLSPDCPFIVSEKILRHLSSMGSPSVSFLNSHA
jgi:hypothetical protein